MSECALVESGTTCFDVMCNGCQDEWNALAARADKGHIECLIALAQEIGRGEALEARVEALKARVAALTAALEA